MSPDPSDRRCWRLYHRQSRHNKQFLMMVHKILAIMVSLPDYQHLSVQDDTSQLSKEMVQFLRQLQLCLWHSTDLISTNAVKSLIGFLHQMSKQKTTFGKKHARKERNWSVFCRWESLVGFLHVALCMSEISIEWTGSEDVLLTVYNK